MAAFDSRRDELARLPAVCCFSRRFPLVSSLLIAECGARTVSGPISVHAGSRPRQSACTVLHADFSSMSTHFRGKKLGEDLLGRGGADFSFDRWATSIV